jgi:hypothetical protein
MDSWYINNSIKLNLFLIINFLIDIVLFNSADVAYSTQRENYLIEVKLIK